MRRFLPLRLRVAGLTVVMVVTAWASTPLPCRY
jgi:hypothetical protein